VALPDFAGGEWAMSTTGRNVIKVVVGSAIGSAVAAGVAKLMQNRDVPGAERRPITEEIRSTPIRLRERWERAREAGAAAELVEKQRLEALFRAKVNDPDALTPPRPPAH
jgi:hypothetical protein